jgi:hypothetical protein
MTTVEVELTVLLSIVLVTLHVYDPANDLVTLGTLYTPRTVGTGIPFGSRTWNVDMLGMFLVIQDIVNKSPSFTAASGNNGSCKAIHE